MGAGPKRGPARVRTLGTSQRIREWLVAHSQTQGPAGCSRWEWGRALLTADHCRCAASRSRYVPSVGIGGTAHNCTLVWGMQCPPYLEQHPQVRRKGACRWGNLTRCNLTTTDKLTVRRQGCSMTLAGYVPKMCQLNVLSPDRWTAGSDSNGVTVVKGNRV